MKGLIIVLIAVLVGLTSCNNYKEVKNDKLKGAFIMNSASTFKGYYYEGSDDSYHYFESKWDFMRDDYFKISIGKFTIKDKYKFKFGDKELRIDLFKENNELFGENEFYNLYVVNSRL
ncbi:hypothetical protein F0919_13520 [Taibaiella lutea]|uniref:Lipoprotein n=1 Tax=Taibaiella lutea TaxID=2608001 RepID=A0A5M6CEG2_9BACT|nr:hypothetical protein [Taibaiella lutea]KAA5533554.1 hypothetical protein F0919_13520 [Taibaiella lutea]